MVLQQRASQPPLVSSHSFTSDKEENWAKLILQSLKSQPKAENYREQRAIVVNQSTCFKVLWWKQQRDFLEQRRLRKKHVFLFMSARLSSNVSMNKFGSSFWMNRKCLSAWKFMRITLGNFVHHKHPLTHLLSINFKEKGKRKNAFNIQNGMKTNQIKNWVGQK